MALGVRVVVTILPNVNILVLLKECVGFVEFVTRSYSFIVFSQRTGVGYALTWGGR